jgi:hypothetical protein
MPATRALGLRKSIRPRRSPEDEADLRVFREVSKLSRRAIRDYVDGLIGSH